MSERTSSSSDDFVLVEPEPANAISHVDACPVPANNLPVSSNEGAKISELENALDLATKEISELRLENSKLYERVDELTIDVDRRIGVENELKNQVEEARQALQKNIAEPGEKKCEVIKVKREEVSIGSETATGKPAKCESTTKLSLSEHVNLALDEDPGLTEKLFEFVRRLLSFSASALINIAIDDVINSGLLTKVVKGLEAEDEKIRYEAAWIITNIVSGNTRQLLAAVNADIIKPLIEMCSAASIKLAEEALWALSNIAGDSVQMRDLLIDSNIVPVLSKISDRILREIVHPQTTFARTLAWTFHNLCRHKPQLKLEVLRTIAEPLHALLAYNDSEVQSEACWAFASMTCGGPDKNIELAAPSLPQLSKFLSSGKELVVSPALRVFGNFTSGNDQLTQAAIDYGVLKSLPSFIGIDSSSDSILKDCFLIISNILGGTREQIQSVLDANLLPSLFSVLKTGELRLQLEASWAVANLATTPTGTASQILEITRAKGSIEVICECLSINNARIVLNMLETIYALFKTVQENDTANLGLLKTSVKNCGGIEQIKKAIQSTFDQSKGQKDSPEPEKIHNTARKIVDEFLQE